MREIQPESSLPPSVKFDLPWLNLQYNDEAKTSIRKPEELVRQTRKPPKHTDDRLFDRIAGSIFGMAIGDALGAHVEFRPREFLLEHPVIDFAEGGAWGLKKGQVRLRSR